MLNLPNTFPAIERTQLDALVSQSRPFLRITGVDPHDWQRDCSDKRRGPWKYEARYEVIDEAIWKTTGEVLYLVVDAQQRLRLVGESGSKLGQRWRLSPMHRVSDNAPLGRHALFHSTAWAELEGAFDRGELPPFTVSAIFRSEIDQLAKQLGGPILSVIQRVKVPNKVAFEVETWICQLLGRQYLWNKAKTSGARAH